MKPRPPCASPLRRTASREGKLIGISGNGDAGPGVEGAFGPEADDAAFPGSESYEVAAVEGLAEFFENNREAVYFSRQIEILHEGQWFHWITKRALKKLEAAGVIRSESRSLSHGGTVTLFWHRAYRYYRRDATKVVSLVNEYADPNIGGALGLQGELLVLEGLAKQQFLLLGRETRSYGSKEWTGSAHDLDFVFERDEVGYGVEVKNTLGYMDHDEMVLKIEMCRHLGLRPLFAVRMLPKTWTNEIIQAGGFALIMKFQLYPWAHRDLARRVRESFGLPVDAPRSLMDGTVGRFLRWHLNSLPPVNPRAKSQGLL